MNEFQIYYIRHALNVTYQSLYRFTAFINPLLWPHGIVNGPSNKYFIIPAEVGVIQILFAYCFWNTVNLVILLFWCYVFHILYSSEVFDISDIASRCLVS